MHRDRIVLIGMMGSGKTTVGRALAARLGWPYRDNDTELRRLADGSPADVLAASGPEALHLLEAEVLDAATAAPLPLVVSAPGSVGLAPELLAGETVVWLRARPSTLAERVGGWGDRPALGDLAALDAERRPGFAAAATLVVDVDDLTVDEVVERIVAGLRASPA